MADLITDFTCEVVTKPGKVPLIFPLFKVCGDNPWTAGVMSDRIGILAGSRGKHVAYVNRATEALNTDEVAYAISYCLATGDLNFYVDREQVLNVNIPRMYIDQEDVLYPHAGLLAEYVATLRFTLALRPVREMLVARKEGHSANKESATESTTKMLRAITQQDMKDRIKRDEERAHMNELAKIIENFGRHRTDNIANDLRAVLLTNEQKIAELQASTHVLTSTNEHLQRKLDSLRHFSVCDEDYVGEAVDLHVRVPVEHFEKWPDWMKNSAVKLKGQEHD